MKRRTALVLRSAAATLWFAAMFFVLIPGLILWASGTPLRPSPGLALWIGVGIAIGAHALVLPYLAAFVREGDGTHAPLDPPRHLVRGGAYERVRNPMYLLYVVVIVGEAIAWRSQALLAYAVLFFLLEHLYVVHREEPALRRRFGEAYDAYCARVPRWWPRGSSNTSPGP